MVKDKFGRKLIASDDQIMLQVKSGKIDKLSILFERYKNSLYSYFYRNTNHPDISEDLVQNVFLRILKYRVQYKHQGKFKSWLYQIAHNLLVDQFKKQDNKSNHQDINTISIMVAEESDELYIKNEEIKLLESALQRLKNEQREILVLSKYQGLKYRDIGEIMDCSEGAVKVRIHRALTELNQIYQQLTE